MFDEEKNSMTHFTPLLPVNHLTFPKKLDFLLPSSVAGDCWPSAKELVGFPNAQQFPDPGCICPRALRSPKPRCLLRIDP